MQVQGTNDREAILKRARLKRAMSKRAMLGQAAILVFTLLFSAAAWAQQPASSHEEIAERYPPLREVEIPEITSHTLPNGIELYLLEDRSLPVISGSASVRAGNLFDPPDKIGVAGITGSVWRLGGTESMTGDQIDEKLESMAASVEAGIGETSGQVSFWTLTENFDEVLAVFSDVLTNPAFQQDKIDFTLQQARSAIARRNDDAAGIAGREFRNLVYGADTPYGWQIEYEHLDRIEKADLEAFYKRYVFPSNIKMAIYGDFSAADMKAKIENAFAGWNMEQAPVPPFPAVPKKPAGGVFLVEKNDVNQSSIRIGHLGGLLKDVDYPALRVMSTILGGGFQSRLFTEVRSNLGLAYQAGAYWGAQYKHPGIFTMSIGTKSESTVQAIDAALKEVERIRSEPVTQDELRTAKDSVLNSFVFNFETPRKTLDRLMIYLYWGYPRDFIFRYKEKIAAVTRQDVQRVAEKYLRPGDLKFVVVGKPADFDKPLDSLGREVTTLDITIPEPKQALSEASEGTIEKGRAILAKALEAAGGAEKLAAVKDVTKKGTLAMGPMSLEQTTQIIVPDVFRQENRMPFGAMTVFLKGDSGWMNSPQGQGPMPEPQIREVRAALFRMRETLLLSAGQAGRTVNFVQQDEVDGEAADVIEISSTDGESIRLWVGSESGGVLKSIHQGSSMEGGPAEIEQIYSDYREAGGIHIPFKTHVNQNGKEYAVQTLTEVIYNSGLDAEALSKP